MESIFLVLYFSLLIGLSLHSLHIPWLIYQRLRHEPIPDPPPADPENATLPSVTVQLPIYNERAVVERLLRAALALRYPRDRIEFQVLDDSTDETSRIAERLVREIRAEGFRIAHHHRRERLGFKAGALKEGTARASGELIAIFDADFVPPPDFLLRVVPCFSEPSVGMVQTRWGHLNENASFLTRMQALFLDGHFVMESQTRDRAGLFLNFNGTAGVWRKRCIEEAGGWHSDTLTEDLDLSYRAQLAGWKFRYLNAVVTPAELPKEVNAFKSQQYRWTRGAVETLRKLGPEVLAARVPVRIKAEFLFHLTSHLVFPALVLLALCAYPALDIRLTDSPWKLAVVDLPLYILGIFSVNVFYLWGQWVAHPEDRRRLFRIPGLLFLGTGLAVSNSIAVWEGYRGGEHDFVRTPKDGGASRSPYRAPSSRSAWFELLLASYLALCILHAASRGHYASIPFLLVFGLGFGGMGVMSVREQLRLSD
ncbi:MAG: glycosyltransferase [Candidatus Omnitrophica bacterium]|nr:glycosyltransferase [Candidatus Omnitrophota bacterium]